jgi:hypothetical protein
MTRSVVEEWDLSVHRALLNDENVYFNVRPATSGSA